MSTRNLFITIVLFIVVVLGFILLNSKDTTLPSLSTMQSSSPSQNTQSESFVKNDSALTTVIAQNLDTPWGLVFLPASSRLDSSRGGRQGGPDNSILLTERPGRVRLINSDGVLDPTPIATLEYVKEIGEGGLLGITIHPDFSVNNYVYFYYTYESNNEGTLNRVVRMTYKNNKLGREEILVDKIPGASNHNGGRIKFGPDNFLYITTGDAQEPSRAQDKNSLAGKILRVTDTGKPAPGNPFGNRTYSYGHRNPQGIAWNSSGELWATEHGRSGLQSGLDELNLIEAGKNYGWPTIEGNKTQSGMETPRLNSGASDTWAPSGAAFIDYSLFFGGLRGQALYEAQINGNTINLKQHFKNELGRIRDVVKGPDGMLYITTSNQDGRGTPKEGDDKIIKVNPQKLY